MQIELCYVTYEAKMSLAAMKRFKELSGRDLWQVLAEFLNEFNEARKVDGLSVMGMMSRLYKVCDFETASNLFYSMIKECSTETDLLARIQDGMFRVGWQPTEHENQAQVWPLVMVKLATDIDEYFKELAKTEKKTLTNSEQ